MCVEKTHFALYLLSIPNSWTCSRVILLKGRELLRTTTMDLSSDVADSNFNSNGSQKSSTQPRHSLHLCSVLIFFIRHHRYYRELSILALNHILDYRYNAWISRVAFAQPLFPSGETLTLPHCNGLAAELVLFKRVRSCPWPQFRLIYYFKFFSLMSKTQYHDPTRKSLELLR